MQQKRRQAVMVGVFVGALCFPVMRAQTPAQSGDPAPQGAPGAPGDPGNGPGRRGQLAGMGRVMGEVTAVAGNTLTVKVEDGSTMQVVTTDNTRLVKDRGPVKVTDMHPGDGLVAFGNLDASTHTLHAAMVMAEDAAQIKAMRENLGKTYITGRVTGIDLDNAKLTVERPDRVSQTIGFDESTSFRRAVRGGGGNGGPGGSGSGGEGGGGVGRGPGGGGMGMGGMAMGNGIDRAFNNGESITLADIKVGDSLTGTGSVKNGVFVPAKVVDSPPGQHRIRGAAGSGQSGTPAGSPGGPAQPVGPVAPGPGGR